MALATMLFSSLTCFAQDLTGLVIDEQSNAISGVNVSVRSLHRYTATDQNGKYILKNLPPGDHTVEYSHIGYKTEILSVTISGQNIENDMTLRSSPFEFRPVTVTANPIPTNVFDSPQPAGVVEGRELDRNRGQSVMQSIEMMPGISLYSGGPFSMKPVIRGLGSQRVVVAENGLRHISQQWDDDQSPELDAMDVERIEVTRGPNSVLFGSDALGGVVNVISTDPRKLSDLTSRLSGNLALSGFSNNRQAAGSLSLFGRNGEMAYKAQLGLRHAGDVMTPAGELRNTGEIELNGKAIVGVIEDWGGIACDYSHFGQKTQIYPDPAALSEITPFQKVAHDRISAQYNQSFFYGRLESRCVWQRDEESEYDAAESSRPNVDLILNSLTLDIRVEHDPIGQMFGTVGISVEGQKNETLGAESLIPAFNQLNAAAFIHEELLLSMLNLSGGLRYDIRRLRIEENEELDVISQTRNYGAVTGVLGAVWHPNAQMALAFNLGRGWRAPIAEELFVDGVDQGGMRYKIGEPNLKTEESFNIDLSARYASHLLKGELSVFRNRINRYIYLRPSGIKDSVSGLIKYYTQQANATIVGAEINLELGVTNNLFLEAATDFVLGRNEEMDTWLPLMPAQRIKIGLRFTKPSFIFFQNPYLLLNSKIVLEQNRVNDFETRTGGYSIFGTGFGGEIPVMSSRMLVDCSLENVFDRAYIDHLSRYKNYALNPGRNVLLKMSVPIDIVQ